MLALLALLVTTPVPPGKLVVRDLEPQGVDAALAASLTAVVVTQLGESGAGEVLSSGDLVRLLDHEQQQQLLGCADTDCVSRLAGSADAPNLVWGSVAKVGDALIVTLTLLRTEDGGVVRRVSRQTDGESALVATARAAARALWQENEPESGQVAGEAVGAARTSIALVVGNSFNRALSSGLDVSLFGPGLELDVARRVFDHLAIYGGAGAHLGSSHDVRFQLVPVSLGARVLADDLVGGLTVYAGLGLGIGFVRTVLAGQANVQSSFSAVGALGAEHRLGAGLALRVEGSYRLTLDTPEALRSEPLGGAAVRVGVSYAF